MKPTPLLLLVAAACTDLTAPPPQPYRPPPIVGLALIAPVAYNLLVGDTITYKAFAYWLADNCPDDPWAYCWIPPSRIAVDSPVTWASSGAGVASVAGGVVIARAPGSAVIRATTAGFSDSVRVTVVDRFAALRAVAAGTGRSCALSDAGRPYCWGLGPIFPWSGSGGPFGGPDLLPRPVPSAPPFAQLAAGGGIVCGVTDAGAGFCWGSGPLGISALSYSATPVAIAGGHAWRQVAVGSGMGVLFGPGAFACGLASDSTGWCWGDNNVGQLGRDSVPDTCVKGDPYPCSREPIAVAGGGARFVAIAAGGAHACGLVFDGTVLCWGANGHGQLGDGTTISRAAPAPVRGGQIFTAIAAGLEHTCGLAGGEVYCWGDGAGTAPQPDPTVIPGVRGLVRLAAGDRTCGLTSSAILWCWSPGADPADVALGQAVTDFAVGPGHACVTTADGRARCWGLNGVGQLGAWTPTGRSDTPVAVSGPVF